MKIRAVARFSLCSSIFAVFMGFSTLNAAQNPTVEVLVERNERVSRHEAHHRVKIANRSGRPIFLVGINYDSGPLPELIFLEQWRTKEGWKTVAPCLDTPPPDVIKLNPGQAMSLDLDLQVPLSRVCKERNIQLEGKFRFRVNYFEREEQARAYLKKFFSQSWQEAHAAVALSEPFEIPPFRDQPGAKPNH